jgi:O-antigen/teichoic acid export membrane protein
VVVAGAVGLVVCGPVATLISYPHPIAIAEAILAAAIWVSLSIERGLLQARGAYESLARNLAFESCIRIAAVIGLVGAGLGVNGAGLGLVIGELIATEQARWASGRTPHRLADTASSSSKPASAKQKGSFADFRYDPDRVTAITGPLPVVSVVRTRPGLRTNTLTALGALVPLALLQNMDVVVVGALNPSGAGPYAAISTACKVPVFTGLAVANFLLPEAVRRLREGEPARGPLAMALVFVVTPGLALTAVGYVAGEQLLSLVFPPELTAGAPVLWVLSLAMTYLAVTLMFTTYLLGAGDRRVVAVLSAGTALTVFGLVVAGGGLPRTTAAALACQAVNASLVGAVVLLLHRRVAGADGTGTWGTGTAGKVGSGRVGESRYDPQDLPAARHRPPDARSGRRSRDDPRTARV